MLSRANNNPIISIVIVINCNYLQEINTKCTSLPKHISWLGTVSEKKEILSKKGNKYFAPK